MALIGQIREKSWLLLVVVGVAMLAFILPWDQIFNGTGSRTDDYGIGTVNGEKVDPQLYDSYKENIGRNMLNNKRQQDPSATSLTTNEIRTVENQAWNALIGRNLTVEEFEKLGLMVSDYELEGLLYGRNGFEPSQMIRQAALDSNGNFNPQRAEALIENLKAENMQQYLAVLDDIKTTRLNEKYVALMNSGVKATTVEAKDKYESAKTVKNVSFVFKKFNEIPATEIEVSDEEIEDYYAEHKNDKKYEQKGTRKVSYFSVPIKPTKEDTLASINDLVKLKTAFEKAENDTVFVMQANRSNQKVSEMLFVPEDSYQRQTPTKKYSGDLSDAKVGDVVGPINNSSFVGIAKIKSVKQEKQAYVRHILISADSSDMAKRANARAKADSVLGLIQSGSDFVEMAEQFNDDSGVEYKYFTEGAMVSQFNDFSFEKPIGSIDVVPTRFGFHIVEVLDRRTVPVFGMFEISRPVEFSSSTVSKRKSEVKRMIGDIRKAQEGLSLEEKSLVFDSMTREFGYPARLLNLLDESPSVQTLGKTGGNEAIKLAYKEGNTPGTLNPFPVKDDNQLVVFYYNEKIEDGVSPLESLKDRIKFEIVKEKQAELLLAEFQGEKDIEVVAQKLGLQIQQQGITFDAKNVTGVGQAPIFVGTVFSGLKDGQNSIPFKGKTGVYMVRIDNTVPAEETTDFSTERESVQQNSASTITSRYQGALIEKAEVIDNRKLRELRLR